jgi:hypothetical protein
MSQEQEAKTLEDLRPFSEITKLIRPGRNGRSIHVSTLSRWRSPGVARSDGSRITLRAIRFPGGWRTTPEWVTEFLDAVTAEKSGTQPTPAPHSIHTPARRRRELDRVERKLAAAGF